MDSGLAQGFGCPDNLPSGVTATPIGEGNVTDSFAVINDSIIASLTFADALPFDPTDPGRMYTQSDLPVITAWSIGDASGAISLSGTTFGPFPDFVDDGVPISLPPLMLSTDADGNIVNYLMAVHVIPHLFIIANPGLEESDGTALTDIMTAFYAPDPGGSEEDEFDLFGTNPGQWTKVTTDPGQPVPEPGTLLLLGTGVAAVGARRFRGRKSD